MLSGNEQRILWVKMEKQLPSFQLKMIVKIKKLKFLIAKGPSISPSDIL